MPYCQQCGIQIAESLLVCARCSTMGAPNAPAFLPAPPFLVQQRPRFQLSHLLLIVVAAVAVFIIIVVALGAKQGINSVIEQAGQESVKETTQHKAEAKAIADVMRQDQVLANAMNTAINATKIKTGEDFDRVAALMKSYVDQARQIDTNACPRDFAEAYFRHISAWSDEAQTVKDHPYFPTQGEEFVEGFFRGLAGDFSGEDSDRKQELTTWLMDVKAKDAQVHKSWEEVQAIAVREGA